MIYNHADLSPIDGRHRAISRQWNIKHSYNRPTTADYTACSSGYGRAITGRSPVTTDRPVILGHTHRNAGGKIGCRRPIILTIIPPIFPRSLSGYGPLYSCWRVMRSSNISTSLPVGFRSSFWFHKCFVSFLISVLSFWLVSEEIALFEIESSWSPLQICLEHMVTQFSVKCSVECSPSRAPVRLVSERLRLRWIQADLDTWVKKEKHKGLFLYDTTRPIGHHRWGHVWTSLGTWIGRGGGEGQMFRYRLQEWQYPLRLFL